MASAVMLQLPATDEEADVMRAELQDATLSPLLARAHIELEDIRMVKRLGAGNFGEVVQGVWRGTPVAVKRIHRHRIGTPAGSNGSSSLSHHSAP